MSSCGIPPDQVSSLVNPNLQLNYTVLNMAIFFFADLTGLREAHSPGALSRP